MTSFSCKVLMLINNTDSGLNIRQIHNAIGDYEIEKLRWVITQLIRYGKLKRIADVKCDKCYCCLSLYRITEKGKNHIKRKGLI